MGQFSLCFNTTYKKMNSFDSVSETFLMNLDLGRVVDHAMTTVANLHTFKGLVLVPVLWWIWFQPGERREWRREMVIATIISALLALAAGRLLADFLPFRQRPLLDPSFQAHFPLSAAQGAMLATWSSFPSDHAMLWASVSAGIFMIWRKVGVLAFLYTAIVICFPRAYLGFHYPTDLLAGAAIGIAITYVMTRDSVRTRYASPSLLWILRNPGPTSMLAFVLCVELVTQFEDLRWLAGVTVKALRFHS